MSQAQAIKSARCAALAFALLALLPARARAADDDRSALIRLAASIVRIEVPRVQGGYSLGSGVAVGAGQVVTNCHVTRDARQINVVRAGVRWPVETQSSDIALDLCLLQVPGLSAPAVPLGHATSLAIGQPVTALGYSGGQGLQHSVGEVVELHRHAGSHVIQSSNGFNSGASGGGLFTADGRLVGILTFRLRGGLAHYFAAPVEWLRAMQGDGRRGNFRAVAALDSGRLAFWQDGEAVQPHFLRAAQLLREERWETLRELASDWLRDDGDTDAQPWHLLGLALNRLDRPTEARAALEQALRLAPSHSSVRAHLASLRASQAAATETR